MDQKFRQRVHSHKHETCSEYSPHVHASYPQNPLKNTKQGHTQHLEIELRIIYFHLSPPKPSQHYISCPTSIVPMSRKLTPWTLQLYPSHDTVSDKRVPSVYGRQNYTFYYNYRHTHTHTGKLSPIRYKEILYLTATVFHSTRNNRQVYLLRNYNDEW